MYQLIVIGGLIFCIAIIDATRLRPVKPDPSKRARPVKPHMENHP